MKKRIQAYTIAAGLLFSLRIVGAHDDAGFYVIPVPTTSDAYPAPVEKSGQTTSYSTGDDGDLEKGVAWPNPRFTDNGNGTVTDNLTGLIWLKNANCFGNINWIPALSNANNLANGACDLTDGSTAGDWHLPSAKELRSLIDYQYAQPTLSNAAGTAKWTEGDAFSGVQSHFYWSSTTYAGDTSLVWRVSFYTGHMFMEGKTNATAIWPVRGRQ